MAAESLVDDLAVQQEAGVAAATEVAVEGVAAQQRAESVAAAAALQMVGSVAEHEGADLMAAPQTAMAVAAE